MATVQNVEAFDSTATVYNFEVEKTHTYYVGTEGVLVHNDCASLIKYLENNSLTNLLNKFNGFSSDNVLKARFVADFEGNAAALQAFNNNVSLINTWTKFSSSDLSANLKYIEFFNELPSSWKYVKVGNTIEVSNATTKLATITETKIIAQGRTVLGESGNQMLNKVPLAKNTLFDVDGFLYQTDELGRVLKTNADLDDIARIRLGNQQIRAVDIKDGVRGDQGGHIVGSRFFGPGEQINLYPQSANLNLGAWKQMENTWAKAMVNGSDVKIEVEAIFTGSSQRPDAFQVSYWIDGTKTKITFINQ